MERPKQEEDKAGRPRQDKAGQGKTKRQDKEEAKILDDQINNTEQQTGPHVHNEMFESILPKKTYSPSRYY